jgi:predicted acylesterase/phospholipase RssA
MTIKHIILTGGGPALGLLEYGILKQLSIKNILKYENIKSLYCTSIGSIIGLIYILNYDWEWIDDFLIKRPWEKLINFDTNEYLNIFNNKGLLDEQFILKCFKPLLLGKDLSINITLKELYDYSKINFYLYTTDLINFDKVELSHKTYPDLSVKSNLYVLLYSFTI